MAANLSRKNTSLGIQSFWALSGLSALGIAQPLLDLLGKNPQFLTIHHFNRWDMVLLLVLLTILPAAFFGFLSWLAGLFSKRLENAVLLGSATLLLSIMIAPMVNGLLPLPDLFLITASVITAFLVIWKLGANPKLRSYWSMLGLIPLLIAGLFLSQSGPRSIAFPKKVDSAIGSKELAPPQVDIPVVMVVFDAFPTNSIMKLNHEIDEALCPNLASFNEDAVWYKNALSISDDTLLAVPAILTGLHPLRDQQPNQASHPNNLFSWLKPWRGVQSFESHTQLNSSAEKPTFRQRWVLTTSDLWIIFLHSILPKNFAAGLPSITHDWLNFAEHDSPDSPHAQIPLRLKLFDDFLASLSSGKQGDCYFLHFLVPHTPYMFLPSGRQYSNNGKEPSGEGMQFGKWSQDLQVVVHSQQRLLQQVGFADLLIGRIIDQLKKTGLYENAMVIFTADHGMSFTPGDSRRKLSPTNRGDILPIPLFIKYPGIGAGAIDDRVVQSIDIMPTIASVLGTALPWASDGQNLLAPSYTRVVKTRYLGAASKVESLEFDTQDILAQRDAGLLTKHHRFPRIHDRMALSAPFRGSELIGTSIPWDLPKWDQWSISTGGDSLRTFSDSLKEIQPAEVYGQITGPMPLPPNWDIAILVDKHVAALTRPFSGTSTQGTEVWSTLLPDEMMVPGQHVLETILVDWSQKAPEFFSPGHQEITAIGRNLILDTLFVSKSWGLYKLARWGDKPATWTKGAANFLMKIPSSDSPNILKVSVLAAGPKDAILMAFANGTLLGVEQPKKFPWAGWFDLGKVEIKDQLHLTFYSTTHIPAETNSNSSDKRSLGMALSLVELQQSAANPRNQDQPFHLVLTPDKARGALWTQVYNTETWADGPTTWTNGKATCKVTWPQPEPPRFLLVEIVGTAPEGSPLTISINGNKVVTRNHIQGVWTQLIDITPVPADDQLEISIISNTFVSSETNKDSQESRVLGVALSQVILVQ